jgi:hypothetical protein
MSKLTFLCFRQLYDNLTFDDQQEFLKENIKIWEVYYNVILFKYIVSFTFDEPLNKLSKLNEYRNKKLSKENGYEYKEGKNFSNKNNICIVCNSEIEFCFHTKESLTDDQWLNIAKHDIKDGNLIFRKVTYM